MARSESYRARPSRDRARQGGRDREIDAITAALTMQIIICVLLLLALSVGKRAAPEDFSRVKEEYRTLVTGGEAEGLGAYLDRLEGLSRGFFSSVEELLQKLLGQNPPAAEQPESASSHEFDYGYLKAQGAAYGSVPTQLAAGGGDAVPADCTLSPAAVTAWLKSPVTGVITSLFAYREHPLSGQEDFHNGIDIAAPEGKSILAALPGEVVETGWDDVYGNYIVLQHATNLQTFYAHCSELIAKEGMAVERGERIARVGSTGVTTGSHLHFSVMVEGLFADPFWVLRGNILLVEE